VTTPDPETGEIVGADTAVELFAEFIREHKGGKVDAEMMAAIQEATSAVMLHGGKASVTLKLSIQQHHSIDDTLIIYDDVVVKAPKEPRNAAIMYGNKKTGALSHEPWQQKMSYTKKPESEA